MSALVLITSFLFVGGAFSQAGRGRGRATGVVLDLEGKPIESAKVTMSFSENSSLKLEETTNKKGEWSMVGLGTGIWNLIVSATGYLSGTRSINVNQLSTNPKITVNLKKSEKATPAFIQDEITLQLLDQGDRMFKEEKYDAALALYREFQQKNPAAYRILVSIGDCYREKGEFEKAMENYSKAVEEAQKDALMGKEMSAKALAGIGNCFVKQGKLREAQDFFRKSIENSPQDEILAYSVGEIYFSNQNPDEALKYFDLASQIKPQWPDPYLKMGYVYLNKGDQASAVVKFEKFLSLEPDTERAARVKNILGMIKKHGENFF
jgi:tetratricopeptide (TPR) repeat protein